MRRRTKKQQRELEDIIKFILLITVLLSYIYTRSIQFTFIALLLVLTLIVSISIYRKGRERERLRSSGIKDIDQMDGFLFEEYLKELYLLMGYKVELTQSVGDYGADLILTKEGKRIVIQAKRYSKNVGVTSVQEIIGAKGYYKADEARVVTNSYFTKPAINLAKELDVKLVDRDLLIDKILSVHPEKKINIIKENEEEKRPSRICPRCNSKLILRRGKRGKFFGCSSFPSCRYTEDIQKEEKTAVK